ncbi:hypothetical protein RHSIM_Rhsim02G0016900 [Rhododendron simsii]|uniref:Uncharacterized protein n=1 Tax=Rhododendron simsii TaxID=118357 RepID=A0A834HAJ9_RHOSS|nr:hypothetical protein RHSIM_Rhsim02G0016900 [Rhododendron simsii]
MDPKANPNAISQPPPPTVPSPPSALPPLHQSDADEEDDSVKQLNECSSVYLSLQVFEITTIISFFIPSKTLNPDMISLHIAGLSCEYQQELEILPKGYLSLTLSLSLSLSLSLKIWIGYLVNDGRGSCLCGTFSFGDGPYFLAEVQALKACNEKRNSDKRK